jgi:N-acetylmuramic acid 6-phosphate etherase
MKKIKPDTEKDSLYSNLEKMSTQEILTNINAEDNKVAEVVKRQIPIIEKLVDAIVLKMKNGGRLFYIGAGTSGRIGVLDASECPPTFGVTDGMVIGIIAGGDTAIRKAVENAEDNANQAWEDLKAHKITDNDVVIGLAASGNTPYVVGGLLKAKENNLITGAIYCNSKGILSEIADYAIELVVGPEFLTGSSRMKAGTSQKLVLNMISTSVMIKLGRVKGNKMVDMQLSNKKLVQRGVDMIVDALKIDEKLAAQLLKEHKSVRAALNSYKN